VESVRGLASCAPGAHLPLLDTGDGGGRHPVPGGGVVVRFGAGAVQPALRLNGLAGLAEPQVVVLPVEDGRSPVITTTTPPSTAGTCASPGEMTADTGIAAETSSTRVSVSRK
jgi:hypothetical protein